MAFTETPLLIKDGDGAEKELVAYAKDDGSLAAAHVLLDTAGAPVNPATSALQGTANASLAAIEDALDGISTAALQSAGNTTMDEVATNTGNVSTNLGAQADSAASSDTGTFSLISLFKRALQSLTTGNSSLSTIAANTGDGAVTLTSTPTTAGTTHAAGDVVGGKISLSGAARVNSGSGWITNVAVCVTDNVTAQYDVLLFDTDPSGSTFTDDAALNMAPADLPSCCGVAHCDDVVDMGTEKLLQMSGPAIRFKISAPATTLYAVIVARASAALTTANGVTLRVTVSQD